MTWTYKKWNNNIENNSKTHPIHVLILFYTSFPPPLQSWLRLYDLPLPLFLPVSGWLRKAVLLYKFSPTLGKSNMFKCLVSNITFLDFEKRWTSGIPTQILRDTGTKHFKPQKTGVCLRKTGTNGILICRMYAVALKSAVFCIHSSSPFQLA